MTMIRCPECAKDISDKAALCPNCGNPLQTSQVPLSVSTSDGHAVTTEATGKHYKAAQLIGALIICAGVISCSAVHDAGMISASFFLIGLVIFLFGRIGAWWHHG